jgi:hypothetical protein
VSRTPVQRLVSLLLLLRAAPERDVSTTRIRQAISDYTEDRAGRKRLERDLGVLREHGMVATGLVASTTSRREGVRLLKHDKPERWELTAREHAALWNARRHLRHDQPIPSALPAAVAPRAERLDLILRLLRVGEENGDRTPVTVPDLARLLGTTRATVEELLDELDGLGGDLIDIGDALVGVWINRNDRPDEYEGEPTMVTVNRSGAVPFRSPVLNRGLDEVGRFAYTTRECDDRITLIDDALRGWAQQQDLSRWPGDHDNAPDASVVDLLTSARDKLDSWRDELHRLSAASPGAAVAVGAL